MAPAGVNMPNERQSYADRAVKFLICGTQKGGTSVLDAYLREHPDLCLADKKEVHFFDDETVFCNGKPDYARYHSLFSPSRRVSCWEKLRRFICIGMMPRDASGNTTRR